jgi:hypothetical protein
MLHFARGALSALLLALNTVAPGLSDTKPREFRVETHGRVLTRHLIPAGARAGVLPFARTELYFGTARPGGVITETEFHDFVDRHVTPRFPHGLTLLKGDGRFPTEDTVIKEQSFVLILLYPYDTFDEGSRHIESIRTRYREEFGQQSVLRVDHPSIVWVSF